MTDDKEHFHGEEDAPVFDPTEALARLGVSEPVEIDIEDERLRAGIISDLDMGQDDEPIPAMDLSAFRTNDHEITSSVLDSVREAREDVERVIGINPKDAVGIKKPDLSLIPPAALLYEAQGMMDGDKKYGAYNWRSNPVKARVYISAAMRHMQQYLDGEEFDPVSGVHHLGHARCCMGILCDARESGNLVDDRPKAGPAGDMIRRFNDTQSFKV